MEGKTQQIMSAIPEKKTVKRRKRKILFDIPCTAFLKKSENIRKKSSTVEQTSNAST
jgi:hypothetical protein